AAAVGAAGFPVALRRAAVALARPLFTLVSARAFAADAAAAVGTALAVAAVRLALRLAGLRLEVALRLRSTARISADRLACRASRAERHLGRIARGESEQHERGKR